jgi:hypothetical protein
MLVAVGMYLPFKTVAAIFVGGLIRWVGDRLSAARGLRTEAEERGTLIASGLIAGEAVLGIVLAALALNPAIPSLGDALGLAGWRPGVAATATLSLAAFVTLVWVLARPPRASG